MLEHFGFTPTAGALYQQLIKRSSAGIDELAELCQLPSAVVASELPSLLAAGAVRHLDDLSDRYVAVPPDLVGEPLIQLKEDELRAARSSLQQVTAAYRNARAADSGRLIEIVDGFDNVRAATIRLQLMAKSEVRVLSRPPYAGQITRPNQVERTKLAQAVGYRAVWDRSALEIPGLFDLIQADMRSGEQTKIFDRVPIKLMIADDRLAVIPLNKLGVTSSGALLVHPSELLSSLAALFELVWQLARPARRHSEDADPGELTDQQLSLLDMLASGMTDEAIARSLGWSGRTVQRHVRRILDVLGADTRLQAGIEAAKRGWF